MVDLKAIRERRNMSQSDLANVLGVSRSAVAMWETSEAFPRGKTMAQLAEVLHCTVDELFGREPPDRSSA